MRDTGPDVRTRRSRPQLASWRWAAYWLALSLLLLPQAIFQHPDGVFYLLTWTGPILLFGTACFSALTAHRWNRQNRPDAARAEER